MGEHAVIIFDGLCNLCTCSVRWIIARDRRGVFRFAASQSETGRALLQDRGLTASNHPVNSLDTLILVEGSRVWVRSEALLAIVRRLPAPWSWLKILRWLPRRLREAGYALVASRRYRWFGKRESCLVPAGDIEERFLK